MATPCLIAVVIKDCQAEPVEAIFNQTKKVLYNR